MFSSFHWDMPSKHHRERLIAIEQYRWFTVGADVFLTANTHVQISDVQVGGRRKGWSCRRHYSADGGLQKLWEKRRKQGRRKDGLETDNVWGVK